MSLVDTSYWRDHPGMQKSDGLWPGYHCNLDKELRRDYGINCGDYYTLYDEQKGKCGICRRKSKKRFHVDHDPFTGEIRGLLCIVCNRNLSVDVVEYVLAPPGRKFELKVNSKRVAMRDRRLAEKRRQTAEKRAEERPEQEHPIDRTADAEAQLKRALESSR